VIAASCAGRFSGIEVIEVGHGSIVRAPGAVVNGLG
jgi:hypothetical protein